MASPKADFYTNHLYIALTAGEWTSDTPSRAVNKVGLSWSELLRKFRKHRPQSHIIAELASYTQALSLLLIRSQKITPEAVDGDHTNPDQPLTLGAECLLLEERREEAQQAYDALQKFPKSDSVYLVLAYYAFALGRYDDTLSQISLVKFDDLVSSANASNVGSMSSALSVPISHNFRTTTGSATGSISPSMAVTDSDVNEGKVWAISERIRGRCLQGMAYESLSQPRIVEALESYESAFSLFDQINVPKSLPSLPGKASVESFIRYRELWRWVERLLWRASILSAKTQPLSHTHRILRIYQAHSVHWPATYRPTHRSTISQLHLHVLLRTYTVASKAAWLNEMRSLVTDYRVLLTATTTFPRAGQRNVKVEEFVDLCVAAWEVPGANGEQSGWVIDILWWATRLTFNSYRIYRHLTRTLYVSGDTDLARRTLKLYVQIVSKARETGVSEEQDRIWVETLVQGARMLCRMPGGIEEAQEAGELIRRASERLDEQDNISAAALRRAEGIWHASMAFREQEPLTRPTHLAASLSALNESIALHPTPSTHFHLALALARPGPSRDLLAAVACVREAVEGDPKEIRYWHLLGLLLAATEDWKGAKAVLDIGAGVGDGDEMEGGEEPAGGTSNGHAIHEEMTRWPNSDVGSSGGLLAADSLELPAAATLQRPVPDYPPPTRHERFEQALQVRLTQLALIEHVDGPENAGDKWVEVFSWVAARKGLGEERRPLSVEPPPSEGNLSDLAVQQFQPHLSMTPNTARTHSPPRASSGIPINLIPPSPREDAGNCAGIPVEGTDDRDKDSLQEKDDHDTSKGRKVQRILKERVHKGQAHIHTISRKIGRGGGRHASRLKRSTSAPDFHAVLSHSKPYQPSSIHSRQRLSTAYMRTYSPEPPPPPASPQKQPSIYMGRSAREKRLLSTLWLTSAATFRRMGKIEQTRAAIQEAEVADEENEDVWVQLGLYYAALGRRMEAIASFHKALFIKPEHVPALVYLTQQYLTPVPSMDASTDNPSKQSPWRDSIDLAAGLLSNLTRGGGWDVPEAWYFLARARGLQGKWDRERECLNFALALVEGRGVRDIMTAVGWCL